MSLERHLTGCALCRSLLFNSAGELLHANASAAVSMFVKSKGAHLLRRLGYIHCRSIAPVMQPALSCYIICPDSFNVPAATFQMRVSESVHLIHRIVSSSYLQLGVYKPACSAQPHVRIQWRLSMLALFSCPPCILTLCNLQGQIV